MKTLLIALCFLLAGSAVSLPLAAATDASLAQFFREPDVSQAKLSPQGHYIAMLKHHDDSQQLMLMDVNTRQQTLLLDLATLSERESSIGQLVWIDENHIAAQLIEVKQGIEDLLDDKLRKRLLIIARPKTIGDKVNLYSVRNKGWMVDSLPSQDNVFYYAKSGLYSKVYQLDVRKLAKYGKKLNKLSKVDGGQFKKTNEVAEISGHATKWFVNGQGKVAAVLHFVNAEQLSLSTFDDKHQGNILKNFDKNTFSTSKDKGDKGDKGDKADKVGEGDEVDTPPVLLPIALGDKPDTFYCLDWTEEENRSVYLVDFANNKQELVYEADAYEVVDLVLSPQQQLIGVKVINDGKLDVVFINDPNLAQNGQAALQGATLISVVNQSVDGNTGLIYAESHNQPGRFLLKKQTAQGEVYDYIAGLYPELDGQLDSLQIEDEVMVEGLAIPYLLNLPANNKQPSSLIVMPHGGPIGVYDNRYYDKITQYLVTLGYGVLRVNIRGSGGFSAQLKAAGSKQWGDLMLEDLYQATRKVITRDDVNGDKVCAFGMSYGGYAALMLSIKHPQLYRCAASFAGVTDINLMLNSAGLSAKQRVWAKKHIGDSKAEYEQLKGQSPVYLANQVSRPLLLVHGEKDTVVDIEHAHRMKMMLDKHQKPYQWHIEPQGTHNFDTRKQQQAFFSRLAGFIGEHL